MAQQTHLDCFTISCYASIIFLRGSDVKKKKEKKKKERKKERKRKGGLELGKQAAIVPGK